MPNMTRVIVAKPLRYGTRHLVPGEEIDMKAKDARILLAVKKVKPMTERAPVELPPIPPALASAVSKAAAEPSPPPPIADAPGEDMRALRDEYERVTGKKPFLGWGADELRARMESAAS